MHNEEGFTKFSLFKLITFLFFWFIYPLLFLIFLSAINSIYISFKGIRVEFVFDDETIIKPKGLDQTIILSVLLFPFRLIIHLLLGLLLSILFYVIHLLPSLGIFPDLANFISCKNSKDFQEYLLNPFFGTNIPIIYFNKHSWAYNDNLIKERVKINSVKRKMTLKEIIIKPILVLCSPICTLFIIIAMLVVWLYRQIIIYSIYYSFLGYHTEGKYINSLSRSSKYSLEKDENKLATILLIVPRIIFRLLLVPVQMFFALMPPFGVLLLPLTFLTSVITFISVCLKVDYTSIKDSLFKSIKSEYFGWTQNEIVGFTL